MLHRVILLVVSMIPLTILATESRAESIATDEIGEDTSIYMLSMVGSESIRSDSKIRVKIFPHERNYPPHGKDTALDQFVLRSSKSCKVHKSDENQKLSKELVMKSVTTMRMLAGKLPKPVIVNCPEGFTLERIQGTASKALEYSGLLYVHSVQKQGKTTLEAINIVDLQNYIRGVVPSEVYRNWPMETLKTQSVAARTYAVYHMVRARRYTPDRAWDVDDTVTFQAYTGRSEIHPATDEAVLATEGQILLYKGRVIQAFYHADSGGATEEANAVWNQPAPFTVSRPEIADLEKNKNFWEHTFNLEDLTKKLQASKAWPHPSKIRKVLVPLAGQTASGRVKALTVLDAQGRYTSISANTFKKVVGTLPSNLFTIEKGAKAGELIVKGLGFGHGVGMSQQGAATLAGEKDWNYRQILDYYYVRTTLCSIDSSENSLTNCSSESLKHSRQVARETPSKTFAQGI